MGFWESVSLRGFSCPAETLDESFFALVGAQHSKAVLEMFLAQFRGALEQCPRVSERLEGLVASEPEFDALWSPAVGMCFRAASMGSASLARTAAAEVLLHAAARGASGSWEVQLARPHFFLWDSWLLPKCDFLRVSSDGVAAEAVTRAGEREDRILFRRNPEDGRWECDGGEPLASVSTERGKMVLLPEGILNPADLDGWKDTLDVAPRTAPARPSDSTREALDLLIDSSPSYGAWVSRVIRRVALGEAKEANYLKNVVPAACGLAFISGGQDALSRAGSLIHQASHNYYYLVTALGPATDAPLDELYYSPFAHMMRTFDRVLSGYHASANVCLFYRACLDALPSGREACAARMGRVLKELRAAEPLLAGGGRLTEMGAALVEPLMRELQNEP